MASKHIKKTVLLVSESSTGSITTFNFLNGSINYFGTKLSQTFENTLIDNIGSGEIRVAINRDLELTNPIKGAKTLKSGDTLSINDEIEYIKIYFIEDSIVEMILISD